MGRWLLPGVVGLLVGAALSGKIHRVLPFLPSL
jgi:hypothetical protein